MTTNKNKTTKAKQEAGVECGRQGNSGCEYCEDREESTLEGNCEVNVSHVRSSRTDGLQKYTSIMRRSARQTDYWAHNELVYLLELYCTHTHTGT